eukprot:TRINITY_DN4361_c0_g1_i1.p2 TRINITY_DN4361_c0_g1~~TRINITY_DN4361_c0_g1_i1.p2  ORF type:complete len:107 (+),score=20.68 TRINITY_DN4361_c0_g1_i1:160-480(+)
MGDAVPCEAARVWLQQKIGWRFDKVSDTPLSEGVTATSPPVPLPEACRGSPHLDVEHTKICGQCGHPKAEAVMARWEGSPAGDLFSLELRCPECRKFTAYWFDSEA